MRPQLERIVYWMLRAMARNQQHMIFDLTYVYDNLSALNLKHETNYINQQQTRKCKANFARLPFFIAAQISLIAFVIWIVFWLGNVDKLARNKQTQPKCWVRSFFVISTNDW